MQTQFYLENLNLDLFDFPSFSKLLSSYLEACKRKDRTFSLRKFNQVLGLKSAGGIQRVIEMKTWDRYLTQISFLMGLEGMEREYLFLLAELEKGIENDDYRTRVETRARQIANQVRGEHTVSDAVVKVANSWLHYVLLRLTALNGAKPEVEWLVACLDEPLKTFFEDHHEQDIVPLVKSAVEELLQVGLLVEQDGQWILPQESLRLIRLSRNYYRENFGAAEVALSFPKSKRRFRNLLYSTTEARLHALLDYLETCEKTIDALLKTPDGTADRVISLDLSWFEVGHARNTDVPPTEDL